MRYCEDVHSARCFWLLESTKKQIASHSTNNPRSTFVGYVVGLATTIVVMNVFKAAQPALLYIVPALFLFTFSAAGASRGRGVVNSGDGVGGNGG